MYNPGVQDRSGELLGRGISSAGASVGAGLQKMLEERKQKAKETKVLRQAFKTFMPDRADEFETMGHEELKGQLLGIQMQEKARGEQSKQAEEASRLDYYKSRQAEAELQRAKTKQGMEAESRFALLNGAELPEGAEGPPRAPAMEGQRILRNASQAGIGPEEMARLATGLAHVKNMDGASAPQVFKGPNGRDFVVHGNSISPAGIDPEFLKEFGKLQGLVDEDGNVIAYGAMGPKGETKIIKATDAKDAQAAASTRKTNTEDLLKRQEALRKIEGGIRYWYESQNLKDEKGKQPKSTLTALVKQKMDLMHPEAAEGKVGKVEGSKLSGSQVEQKPKADTGKAEEIGQLFKAGKISKEEAVKRLKEVGYAD